MKRLRLSWQGHIIGNLIKSQSLDHMWDDRLAPDPVLGPAYHDWWEDVV